MLELRQQADRLGGDGEEHGTGREAERRPPGCFAQGFSAAIIA